MKKWISAGVVCVGLVSPALRAETALKILPEVFDFGWAPDNALLTCQFHVKNVGGEMVPLTAVQPSCGCTATDFTPDAIPASEEKAISLTFNTRGYTGMSFDKNVAVKAGMPEEQFNVRLKGHVTKTDALVVPENGGIASFEDGKSEIKIPVQNKTNAALSLTVVQDPDGWADVTLPKKGLPAMGQADLEIEASGSLSDTRHTSVTIEASDGKETHRFTVAIRTGEVPEPVRRIRSAPKSQPAKKP